MKQFDASDINTAFVQCAVCEKESRTATGLRESKVFASNPHLYIRRIETLALCASVSTMLIESASVLPLYVVLRLN